MPQMKEYYCHNYPSCRLINFDNFPISVESLQQIKSDYCEDVNENWLNCRRYIVKKELGFCPDFVFPDTEITLSEIIDRFENEINPTT
jgi:hypothetical protein